MVLVVRALLQHFATAVARYADQQQARAA
jgi:hypothetical protein